MKSVREVGMINHALLRNYLAVTGQEPSENYIPQMEWLLLLEKKKMYADNPVQHKLC